MKFFPPCPTFIPLALLGGFFLLVHQALAESSLPDTDIAIGAGVFSKVWLTGPTRIYSHGALGDAIEARGVAAEDDHGRVQEFLLPGDSVFEDRTPRLVSTDEGMAIMLVRSYLDSGAALVLLQVGIDGLKQAAQSQPIGRSFRWLNPIGAADLDGDGKTDYAAVITPHIGGILKIYRRSGNRLVEKYAVSGFSNHRLGSRNLGLSMLADVNADGVKDILVPSANLRTLRLVSFVGGQFNLLKEITLPASISGDLRWVNQSLEIPLTGGSVVRIQKSKLLD